MPRWTRERLRQWKHRYGLFHPLGCTLVERPPGSRVLVLAAHPDDEAIGCGGTLRKHALAGEPVVCIYLTDGVGTAGAPGLPEGDKRERIEAQARAAGAVLGVKRQVFCRERFLDVARVIGRVRTVWDEEEPELVYLPFVTDGHREHVEVNRLLLTLLDGLGNPGRLKCAAYEIWSPLEPNCSVNISGTLEAKQQAIAAYAVATEAVGYVHASTGLAAYRSLLNLSGCGYAEAFFVAPAVEYAGVVRRILGGSART